MNNQEQARLDELEKTEWRDVARIINPEITDKEFDAMWEKFIALKRAKGLQ